MTRALEISDTVPAGLLRHRLALGLELRDALRQTGALGPLCVDIESIGTRAFPRIVGSDRRPMRFDVHRADRHATRYDGRAKKLVDAVVRDLAVNAAAEAGWIVRVYAPRRPTSEHYDPENDARIHVPRRLRLELSPKNAPPVPGLANIRAPWLWPGSAYPVDETATVVRGRVLRGATIETAKPVRWVRVFLTDQVAPAAFDAKKIVGSGHGDDRGDFVVALRRYKATSGVDLPANVDVCLFAFAPPALPLRPGDSLSDLPIENAGLAKDGNDTSVVARFRDALRGDSLPAGYTLFDSRNLTVPLGSVKSDDTTTLLKP